MGRGSGVWPRGLLVTTMMVMLGSRALVRAFNRLVRGSIGIRSFIRMVAAGRRALYMDPRVNHTRSTTKSNKAGGPS